MLDAFSFNLQVPLYPFPPVTYTFKNQDLLTCVLNTRTLLSAFSGCSLPHFFVPYISHELAAGGGLIISLRFHLSGSTAGDGEHFVWFSFCVMLTVPCPLIHSGFAKAVLIGRANSLEKSPMLGKIESNRRRGRQRMRWLNGITN